MSQTPNDNKAIHDETEIHENCIFCKIVRNEIPAVKVYEDDDILAFLDIKPNTRGHVLVIPKIHFENLYGLPAETACRVMLTVQRLAVAMKNALDADGTNILMNNESSAGQLILHSHTHIIPRYNEEVGTGGHFDFAAKHYTYIAGEMEEIAEKVKKEL